MEHPKIGDLWAWRSSATTVVHFLVTSDLTKSTDLSYDDPRELEVIWLDNNEVGKILIDMSDFHKHIYKVI